MKRVIISFVAGLALAQYQPPGGGIGTGLPTEPGVQSYLRTDGVTPAWGNITTGGSGLLDCTTTPGQCDLITDFIPLKASNNVYTGMNDFSGGFMSMPETLTANLPDAAGFAHRIFLVTDSMAQNVCNSGGGSAVAICRSDGSNWVALGVGQ